jgi:hypothetical protein
VTGGGPPPAAPPPDGSPPEPARPAALRAYVNERGVDVAPGGTALDAVRAFDALGATAYAAEVAAGARVLADSRGLAVDPATAAHGGAIYRLLPARAASAPAGPHPAA